MKKILNGLLALFLCFSLVACKPDKPRPEPENEAFQEFTNSLIAWYYPPTEASIYFDFAHPEKYGITLGNPDFKIPSLEKVQEGAVEAQEKLAKLKEFDYSKLNSTEQLTYDVLVYNLQSAIDAPAFYYLHYGALGSFIGANCDMPYYYIAWPLLSKEYLDAMLFTIDELPATFQNWIDFEVEKAKHGYPMMLSTYQAIVEAAQKIVDAGDDYFLIKQVAERIKTVPGLSEEEIIDYQQRVTESLKVNFIGAYRLLTKQLPALYDKAVDKNKAGLSYFDGGDDYYLYMLRYNVGVDDAPQEVYDYLAKKLTAQFTEFFDIYGKHPEVFDVNIEEKFAIMSNDNEVPKVMDYLSSQYTKVFPAITPPDYIAEQVDETQQDAFSPAAYFTPLLDSDYRNLILVNPKSSRKKYTTIAHETYPGHLYQFNYVAQSDLPMIRKIMNVTGYAEGWAVYADHYAMQFVPDLKDYEIRFYQLNEDIIYTLWGMIDIGVNYKGWGIPEILDFLSPYLNVMTEEEAEEFLNVIQENPTNMLQYYYSYYLIEDFKIDFFTNAKKATEMKFNTSLVETGHIPFTLLKRHLKIQAAK